MRRGAILLLLTLMITASYLTLASPAWASTLTVNSFNDRGDQSPGDRSCFTGNLVPGGGIALVRECTLRAAIEEANFNEQPDIITFASWLPGGTITLKEGRLTIANDNTFGSDLTIEGSTGGRLIVSGIRTDRVFEIASGSEVTINRLTITGGAGDSSFGGGIQNSGTLALTNSTVSNNTAQTGGGIANLSGGLTLTNSTVSNNTAQTGGGGIHNTGTLALTNSTVSNNTAQIAGGGIYNNFGTATLANTIVASNAAPTNPDARGDFTSQANNLIGNTGNSSGWSSSDLLNLDPLLGPLQNNGGPTNTRALLPASPAIDRAADLLCPSTDQRGVQRKDGDGNGSIVCDIGAYERSDFSSPKVSSTTPTGTTPVKRGANISATFTEQMTRSTLNTSTFKLFKVNAGGSTTQITNVTVSSTTDGLKATLNPFGSSSTLLAANSTYKAVVSTGARDLAGNQLDQSTLAGNQQKAWTFTTSST